MSSHLSSDPSFALRKVDSVVTSSDTEIIFFDQVIEFLPIGAQLLTGILVDPSGEGHVEDLYGVSIQTDADTGLVLDTLRKGQLIGCLDNPPRGATELRISIHIERHGRCYIPHLSLSDRDGNVQGSNLDKPWASVDETLSLPAFFAPPKTRLTSVAGYYTESFYRPEFGSHQMCLWPDDVM